MISSLCDCATEASVFISAVIILQTNLRYSNWHGYEKTKHKCDEVDHSLNNDQVDHDKHVFFSYNFISQLILSLFTWLLRVKII